LPTITLNNNIEQGSLRVGQNFNFVLNYCKNAGSSEGINKPICEQDDETLDNYASLLRISHKFVRQYFNPKTYTKKNPMSYVGDNRMTADIMPGATPINKYNII
jgi:hypothetical protein